MDLITISELEVSYCVGVTEEERATPQRLLLSIELLHDFTIAASRDDLWYSIDYQHVCNRLLALGEKRSWKLIERVAVDIADLLLREYKPAEVSVEVKKFSIPKARHVSVCVRRVHQPTSSRR